MVWRWGGPEGWQRAMTNMWIGRLAGSSRDVLHVLDAQVRPDWALDALRSHGVRGGLVVLLDCAVTHRHTRDAAIFG